MRPLRRAVAAVVVAVLGGAVLAHAGAQRTVWMDADETGTRPELALVPSGSDARACLDALAHAGTESSAIPPRAGRPPGLRGRAAYGPPSVGAACAGMVGLKHATRVELLPPPGACGAGFARVRVRDGAYRGRTGCVRAGALRVPGSSGGPPEIRAR